MGRPRCHGQPATPTTLTALLREAKPFRWKNTVRMGRPGTERKAPLTRVHSTLISGPGGGGRGGSGRVGSGWVFRLELTELSPRGPAGRQPPPALPAPNLSSAKLAPSRMGRRQHVHVLLSLLCCWKTVRVRSIVRISKERRGAGEVLITAYLSARPTCPEFHGKKLPGGCIHFLQYLVQCEIEIDLHSH